MSRTLFQRATSGYATVRGGLIKQAQVRLEALGSSPGELDGVFGQDTERALLAWQEQAGFPRTGAFDVESWQGVVSSEVPSMFERALQLTAVFEGHGFGKVAGNFDGAWLTWGIIGFTLKHGEVDAILLELHQRHPDVLAGAFGHLMPELLQVLHASGQEKRNWANSISVGQKRYRVLPNWSEAFEKLGDTPEAQAVQLKRAGRYWDIALRDAERVGLGTELGLALCFDIAVQNGGLDGTEAARIRSILKKDPPEVEQDIRKVVATVVAESSLPKYVEDVRSRKMTIALGEGVVHGSRFKLKAWGLADLPWQA